jgi:hypothetical protein
MALPALKFEPENIVENRVAVLENHVEYIRSDIGEVKVTQRRLEDKIDGVDQKLTAKIDAVDQKLTAKIDAVDQKLTAKIDAVDQKLTAKIEAVDEKLTGKIDAVDQKLSAKIDDVNKTLGGKIDTLTLAIERSLGQLKVDRAWDRVAWLLIAGGLLSVMARAFKWI